MSDGNLAHINAAAVVVTHHPDAGIESRLRATASQFRRVIVVDNRSTAAELAGLEFLTNDESRLVLLKNSENLGIATALNQGCQQALNEGIGWVAMFDQDSVPSPNLLVQVTGEWAADAQRDRIGLIGVNYRFPSGATIIPAGVGLCDAKAVITSGSLLNLQAWREAGPFREDFFIDEVDHEFSLRLRRRGWAVKMARSVLMDHVQGSPRNRNIAGWRLALSHHSAVRRYYMVRNRLLMARAYWGFDPVFVGLQLGRSLREGASVLLFESDKSAKLSAMAQGFMDGLRGRTGRALQHLQ